MQKQRGAVKESIQKASEGEPKEGVPLRVDTVTSYDSSLGGLLKAYATCWSFILARVIVGEHKSALPGHLFDYANLGESWHLKLAPNMSTALDHLKAKNLIVASGERHGGRMFEPVGRLSADLAIT